MGSTTISMQQARTLRAQRVSEVTCSRSLSCQRYRESPRPKEEAQVSNAGINHALLPLKLAEVLSLEHLPIPMGIWKWRGAPGF